MRDRVLKVGRSSRLLKARRKLKKGVQNKFSFKVKNQKNYPVVWLTGANMITVLRIRRIL